MESTKISFRVSDQSVKRTLQVKKESGEMSAYINKALIFYENNVDEIPEFKQALIQLKYILEKIELCQSDSPD